MNNKGKQWIIHQFGISMVCVLFADFRLYFHMDNFISAPAKYVLANQWIAMVVYVDLLAFTVITRGYIYNYYIKNALVIVLHCVASIGPLQREGNPAMPSKVCNLTWHGTNLCFMVKDFIFEICQTRLLTICTFFKSWQIIKKKNHEKKTKSSKKKN